MPAWLAYFLSPFPSASGFSAYRSPGVAVHVPVTVLFGLLGLAVCGGSPALRPLVIVWLVLGVYVGRDVAILSHYGHPGCLVGLAGWVATVLCLIDPTWFPGLVHEGEGQEPLAAGATAGAVVLFGLWVRSRVREASADEPGEEPPPPPPA